MMKEERNSSLDALRCLSMFLIILSHTYYYGCLRGTSFALTLLFSVLPVWHVDAFTSFSGWFGIKCSLRKFIRLYGVIVFYSVLGVVAGRFLFHRPVPFGVSGGWYGDTYLCLFLIAPFLNAGVDAIVQKGTREAWLAWAGFAVVVFANWLSRTSYFGFLAFDVAPYTLVQLTFVYVTARLVRLTNVASAFRCWHLVLAVVIYGLISVVIVFLPFAGRQNYLAPHVIGVAVALLILFARHVRIPNWAGRFFVWMAPSMFGIYLIHENAAYGHELYQLPLRLLTDWGVPGFWAIVASATVCFCFCFGIDFIRRCGVKVLAWVWEEMRSGR